MAHRTNPLSTFTTAFASLAMITATTALADGGGSVLLHGGHAVVTQGTTAQVQVRATTEALIGGFSFEVQAAPLAVQAVNYNGPIFSEGWEGWDNAPDLQVFVSAACIFTEDQVEPGDHNLVTLEVDVPAFMPAGTVIPLQLVALEFFNYDFSIPALDARNGSIKVVRSADLDGDGTVTAADFGRLFAAWGVAEKGDAADLDADGFVNGEDLGRMIDRWGTSG